MNPGPEPTNARENLGELNLSYCVAFNSVVFYFFNIVCGKQ